MKNRSSEKRCQLVLEACIMLGWDAVQDFGSGTGGLPELPVHCSHRNQRMRHHNKISSKVNAVHLFSLGKKHPIRQIQ
jgi:hypothetical protein